MAHLKRRNLSIGGRRRLNNGGSAARPATASPQAGPTAKPTRRKRWSPLTLNIVGGAFAIAAAVVGSLLTWLLSSPGSLSASPSSTAGTRSAASSLATPDGSAKSTAATGPTPPPKTPSAQATSPQPAARMALQIRPDHGGISRSFEVSGTGCPHQGDQIDIYFDGKALFPAPTCQADHTYQKTYIPGQNGMLPWIDGNGNQRNLTLSPGWTYTVQACTITIRQVCSSRVTYRAV
jgi:hypothetical protein